MFSAVSVCSHDNFQMIQHRMTKLDGQVHCTKISSEFECQGQGHRGQKTKKCGIFFASHPLGHSRSLVLCRWENQCMLSSVTIHSSQLSLLPSVGLEMSTGRSVVMLCGWGVKAGLPHTIADLNMGGWQNCMIPCQRVPCLSTLDMSIISEALSLVLLIMSVS